MSRRNKHPESMTEHVIRDAARQLQKRREALTEELEQVLTALEDLQTMLDRMNRRGGVTVKHTEHAPITRNVGRVTAAEDDEEMLLIYDDEEYELEE